MSFAENIGNAGIIMALCCPNNREGRLYNYFLAGGAGSVCDWGIIMMTVDIIILILLGFFIATFNQSKKVNQ